MLNISMPPRTVRRWQGYKQWQAHRSVWSFWHASFTYVTLCMVCHTISWFFLFFWILAKLFLSPSHKPHLLCTSHTTNHRYFYLFIFLSKQNELLVHSRYNWEESLPHTNSLILSFKSKHNDFWMSPRTFKGKHPFYNSDITIFHIRPVRIRLSLFT